MGQCMKKILIIVLLSLIGVLLVISVQAGELGAETVVSSHDSEPTQPLTKSIAQIPHVIAPAQRYIVQFNAPPIASVQQRVASVDAYRAFIASQQANFLQVSSLQLGRPLQAEYQYDVAFNGMALILTGAEVAQIEVMSGVTAVYPDHEHELATDVGPAWIGAPQIWNGTAVPGNIGNRGEGIIVAIIDTGINMDHPSFAEVGGDGYVHQNPLGVGKYRGVCDPENVQYDPQYSCNSKLIGAWNYTDGPEDTNGHGSHVASTAVGNIISATVETATGYDYTTTISGVAPHANIIAYDVCIFTCATADLLAAVNQAVADDVDVINYSISGGESPYIDPVAQAFLVANEAGIFVSAAAGNNGPGVSTLSHQAPWVMTVGAMTHDRAFINQLINISGGNSALSNLTGKSMTDGYGPAPIVYAGDFGDALCQNPFAPSTFSGQIVICDRGIVARVDKGDNVLAGGAGGMVLANAEEDDASLNADAHHLPAVHINYTDGVLLKNWLATGSGHMGEIRGTTAVSDSALADIMADFSSRGPNTAMDVIKPDIAGPGVDILAAIHTTVPLGPPEFGMKSGTSMATPHLAGAVALLRKAHPSWTPDEVRSALMMTSVTTNLRKEDGFTPATPFDRGAGRVDLTRAAMAGLLIHETKANYDAAQTGDPTTLNIPSLAESSCFAQCAWTRTVHSSLSTSATWTATAVTANGLQLQITPSQFTLAPGAPQTLQIEADVTQINNADGWQFATIELSSPGQETLRLPVAVLKSVSTNPGVLTKTGPSQAQPDEIITYEISLDNLDNMTHTFQLTDTLPVGVTYVPNSATGGLIYDELNRQLTWQGEIGLGALGYEITTVNPPLSYINLGDQLGTSSNLCDLFSNCDDTAVHFDLSGEPASYTFYGESLTDLFVSANGVIYGPEGHLGVACAACPQPVPVATELNQVMAGLWRDLDASFGTGQWHGALLEDWIPGHTVFYANWHDVGQAGDPFTTSRHAIAIVLDGQTEPNGRIYYLYDYVPDPENIMDYGYTIGVENKVGDAGQIVGFAPCADASCTQSAATGYIPAYGTTLRLDPAIVGGASAKTFTYQVQVKAEPGTLLTNSVDMTFSGNSEKNTAVADVSVAYRTYLPIVFR